MKPHLVSRYYKDLGRKAYWLLSSRGDKGLALRDWDKFSSQATFTEYKKTFKMTDADVEAFKVGFEEAAKAS